MCDLLTHEGSQYVLTAVLFVQLGLGLVVGFLLGRGRRSRA